MGCVGWAAQVGRSLKRRGARARGENKDIAGCLGPIKEPAGGGDHRHAVPPVDMPGPTGHRRMAGWHTPSRVGENTVCRMISCEKDVYGLKMCESQEMAEPRNYKRRSTERMASQEPLTMWGFSGREFFGKVMLAWGGRALGRGAGTADRVRRWRSAAPPPRRAPKSTALATGSGKRETPKP